MTKRRWHPENKIFVDVPLLLYWYVLRRYHNIDMAMELMDCMSKKSQVYTIDVDVFINQERNEGGLPWD